MEAWEETLNNSCAILLGMAHEYGLSWIDEEQLFLLTKEKLSRSLGLQGNRRKVPPPDPFAFVLQAKAKGTPIADMGTFEELRVLNKTVSDAIGNWHQGVLALSPNWRNLGFSGGVLDIRTVDGYRHPSLGKPIVAEVKNRFNTIKASDEKNVWDDIDRTARSNDAIGYLIQIVPKLACRYDEPWSPSGRMPRETVRHCDGVTGYELVFGYSDALPELLEAFPKIIDDVLFDAGCESRIFPHDIDYLMDIASSVFDFS